MIRRPRDNIFLGRSDYEIYISFSHCWNQNKLAFGRLANLRLIRQINPVVDRPTTIHRRTQNTQHRTKEQRNKGGGWRGLWRAMNFVCCVSAAFGLIWNSSFQLHFIPLKYKFHKHPSATAETKTNIAFGRLANLRDERWISSAAFQLLSD